MKARGMRGGTAVAISNPMLDDRLVEAEELEDEQDELGGPGVVDPIALEVGVLASYDPAAVAGLSKLQKMVDSRGFALLEVVLILATVWGLALDSPAFPPETAGTVLVATIEGLTSAAWTLQLGIKVAAATPRGYFLAGVEGSSQVKLQKLNLLDVWVVISSWLAMIDFFKERGFGTMRLLRLSRAVPLMRVWSEELADLIDSLFASLTMLRDVVIFIVFVIFMFAILGLHIFQGSLSHQCATNATEVGAVDCPDTLLCDGASTGGGAAQCVTYSPPLQVADKENFGFYGFNNMVQSTFVVFEQISLDGGFHDLPQLIASTDAGSRDMAWNFFAVVVLVLNVLVLNLFVAVIVSAFDTTRAARAALAAREAYLEEATGERSADSGNKSSPLATVADMTKDPMAAIQGALTSLSAPVSPPATGGSGNVSPASPTVLSDAGSVGSQTREPSEDDSDPALSDEEARRASKEGRGVVEGSGREKLVDLCFALSCNNVFSAIIMSVIFANVVVLCMYHQGMDPGLKTFCASSETFFLFVFFVEASIKLTAHGTKEYFADGLNTCDFCVLVVSTAGIVINIIASAHDEGHALNLGALRALRLTRLVSAVRVIYRYESVRMVVQTAFQSLSQLLALCFLMIFCIIFAALAGMHIYGDSCDGWCARGVCPDVNQQTCSEKAAYSYSERVSDHYIQGTWDSDFATKYTRRNFETFGAAMISVVQHVTNDGWSQIMMYYMYHTSKTTVFFFWAVHIITAYVLVNLFVAIIMQNFSLDANVKLSRQVENYERYSQKKSKQAVNSKEDEEYSDEHRAKLAKSLYLFAPENPVRRFCCKLVKHPVYDFAMCGLVVFACWLVAWSGAPGSLSPSQEGFVDAASFVVWVLFTLEVVIKSVAFHFWVKPLGKIADRPYLRRGANRLDFMIVVMIGLSYALAFAKTLGASDGSDGGAGGDDLWVGTFAKAMRALQPLRVLNRHKGLQRISNTLVVSMPAVGAVLGLLIIFWLCFAIVGVESYSGIMYRCVQCDNVYAVVPDIETMDECLAGSVANETFAAARCWENPPYNFDSFFHAMETLFKASTMVGWIDIMESCQDSRGLGLNPRPDRDDANPYFAVFYWMMFNVVINLFLMKLFVGVMATSFSSASGNNLVTEHQKKWIRVQRMIDEFNPKDSHEAPDAEKMSPAVLKLRTAAFNLAEHPWFALFIDGCIILNILCLAVAHYPKSDFLAILDAMNTFFLVVFTVELLVKVLAYGLKGYLTEAWNRMDMFVVAMSWAGRFMSVRSGAELARVFRTARVFLVFHKVEGLTTLFSTILAVLPSAFYMIVLIFLLFFVYAVLGMQLFGDEPCVHPNYNADNNFSDFTHSMKLLFQITVGQSMTYISHDLRHHGIHVVFMYFGSFYIWSSYVMMNLFVGVLVDTFDLQHTPEDDENPNEFPAADMWVFRTMWRDACVLAATEGGYDAAIRGEADRNPSLLELPYDRVYQLLLDLGEQEASSGDGSSVLHVRASDPDWMYYTLLQTELYAYKIQPSMRIPGLSLAKSIAAYKKNSGPKQETGRYGPRGVSFHWLIKRLALRRLKKSTLMYQSLMEELETEEAFVSQNIIAAMFSARILLKYGPEYCPAVAAYFGEGEGSTEPSEVWQKVSRGTFEAAVRGVRDLRISRLSRLRRLIQEEHAGFGDVGTTTVNPETGSPMASPAWRPNSPQAKATAGGAARDKTTSTKTKVLNPMMMMPADAES